MLMEIETYEMTEVDSETGEVEDLEARVPLLDELGLCKQKDLIKRDDNGNMQVNTFRLMTAEEIAVYKQILPREVKIEEFDQGHIPLRILEMIKECKPIFNELRIWRPENVRDKDPLLVGTNEPTYMERWFIIARWGEVLEPFSVLKERAQEQFYQKTLSAMKLLKRQVKADLKAVKEMDPETLLLSTNREPYYNGLSLS